MSRRAFFGKLCGSLGVGGSLVCYGTWRLWTDDRIKSLPSVIAEHELNERRIEPLRSRREQLLSLRTDKFDVLVIGGGATGCGVALDAVSRGLKTALVEMDDFSAGTSSRSTKLIHGGVRYLEKAVFGLDIEQYKIVKEALFERANLLAIAPHLAYPLPIMLPVYRFWQVPYFWAGIKAYDFVAGSQLLKPSYFIGKKKALERFPMLKTNSLVGALIYYDGAHNDARMNIAIAITAARLGVSIANHASASKLIKDKEGKVCGAVIKDELSGEEFCVMAKCVVNATGPFSDDVRKMDDPDVATIVKPSMGVHITLPDYYSPAEMGLLDPSTKDGRVIFFLPWEKHTIAGTTDTPCPITHHPSPTEDDIQFILAEIRHYLSPDVDVRRGDVLSAWSGIRPLVSDPSKTNTQSIARNHIVHVSDSGLVTVAGGKWTTYRAMAEDTITKAVEECNLKPISASRTAGLLLEGAHFWTPTLFIRLVQDFGLETEVAQHLSNTYGDRALSVAKMASLTGKRWPVVGRRIHEDFPYIDAEVRYAVREYACTAVDVIGRRLRLAFLNVQAAEECLPRVIDIMAEELNWNAAEKKKQFEQAKEFLDSEMGGNMNKESREKVSINLTKEDMSKYIKRFQQLDKENKGFISVNDLRLSLKTDRLDGCTVLVHDLLSEVDIAKPGQIQLNEFLRREEGKRYSAELLQALIREADLNQNGLIELDEYLQMMAAIKSGGAGSSRLECVARQAPTDDDGDRGLTSVARSGGGV